MKYGPILRDRRDCARMLVGFTPTYVISAYHHSGQVQSIQHYVIKFVSDLRQVRGFSPVSSTNKTDIHDIVEILLKVALKTITMTLTPHFENDPYKYK